MCKSFIVSIASFLTCLALTTAKAQGDPAASDPAAASVAAAPPSEEAKKEASGHFRRAVELYQEGAFRAALVEFQRAYEIAPDYRLLYNIGQAQLQVQDYLGATQAYERYLEEGGAQVAAERRSEVETALGALRERVARLSIQVNLDGADVFVDDQPVGKSPITSAVPVNVGRHRVYVRLADGTDAERIVDAAGGDMVEVTVELSPKVVLSPEPTLPVAQEEERTPLSRKKRTALAMWGVALATGVGAIVTGVMAKGKADDYNEQLELKPPAGEADPQKARDFKDSAETLGLTTDILAATALASGVTGLVLWLVDGKGKTPERVEVGASAREHKRASSMTRVSWGVGLGSFTVKGKF